MTYTRAVLHIDPWRYGRFADRDTEAVWLDQRVRRFQSIQAQAKRRLNVLNAAATLEWAAAVNDQYRIAFDWNDGPTNVELTDYHR